MIRDIYKLMELHKSKCSNFLYVDFNFYKKWALIIHIIVFFNKNYINCKIFKLEHKNLNNIAVVGLKTRGKNVRRRTNGYAKKFISERDDCTCIYCNIKLTDENATTDHIIPISKKGNNSQVNLIVCCNDCNGDRGTTKFEKYLKNKNKKYKRIRYIFV